jgi:hypothetical protein
MCVVASAGWSCKNSPASPTPAPVAGWKNLLHFEELVGTAWTGTVRFASTEAASASAPVELVFLWLSVVEQPYGGVMIGYSPYGWGTVDGLPTRVRGYNAINTTNGYNRHISVGDSPVLGAGQWTSARVTGDLQRLEVVSPDFTWEGRRGATFVLTRTPWPADVTCPSFRNCGT